VVKELRKTYMVCNSGSINIAIVNNNITVWDNIRCHRVSNFEMVCRCGCTEDWSNGSRQSDEASKIGGHDEFMSTGWVVEVCEFSMLPWRLIELKYQKFKKLGNSNLNNSRALWGWMLADITFVAGMLRVYILPRRLLSFLKNKIPYLCAQFPTPLLQFYLRLTSCAILCSSLIQTYCSRVLLRTF